MFSTILNGIKEFGEEYIYSGYKIQELENELQSKIYDISDKSDMYQSIIDAGKKNELNELSDNFEDYKNFILRTYESNLRDYIRDPEYYMRFRIYESMQPNLHEIINIMDASERQEMLEEINKIKQIQYDYKISRIEKALGYPKDRSLIFENLDILLDSLAKKIDEIDVLKDKIGKLKIPKIQKVIEYLKIQTLKDYTPNLLKTALVWLIMSLIPITIGSIVLVNALINRSKKGYDKPK